MLDKYKKINILTYIAVVALSLSSTIANAGTCSPGIPCTGYDIYSQPTANTTQNYNGPKSNGGSWSAGTPPTYTFSQSACDGNFMNQIYARAFLEAQREVMLSEQIIHKPDSVLEYTCFDHYAGLAAEHIDSLFSARQDWDDREIPTWTADDDTSYDTDGDGNDDAVTINNDDVTPMPSPNYQTDYSVFEEERYDNILEGLLLTTIENYIDNNFAHTFMGESITLDNDLDTTNLPTGAYDCAHMLAIWEIAKCIDFGEDDRFRSFNTLATSDIRSIPQACPIRDRTTSDGSNAVTPTTQIASDVIENGSDPTKLDNTSSGEDLMSGLGVSMPGVSIPIPSVSLSTGGVITRMPSDAPLDDCPAAGGPATNVNTDISNDLIRIANNCDDGTNTNVYSATDLMESYEHLIKGFGIVIPGTGSPSAPSKAAVFCSDPIPTGLPVLTYIHSLGYDSEGLPTPDRQAYVHYDHICPNPGCYYQPAKILYNPILPIPDADTISIGLCLQSF